MDIQKFILQGIRPALSTEFILADEKLSLAEKIELIRKVNYDSIRFNLHFAQEVRILRRIQAAKKFQLLPKSESLQTIGSSDDSLLFGHELRKVLNEELALENSRKNSNAKGRGQSGGIIKSKPPHRNHVRQTNNWNQRRNFSQNNVGNQQGQNVPNQSRQN